ncbi:MAG: serine/threonine protein kinase, partial [Myxococcales bacterium]|nr:serine/threonine protein kinase [Myxococcales bacterium]
MDDPRWQEDTVAGEPSASEPDTDALDTPSDLGRRVGRYVILEELGAGAVGQVFAAYDPQLDRKVALKRLQSKARKRRAVAESRLRREAQALARLNHVNVVTVHEVAVYDGQLYIVMEYVAGQTLRAWLERPRDWREVLRVFTAAGRGLQAAHAEGLVHRDFKPQNALVGDDGRPQLVDFGLARGDTTAQLTTHELAPDELEERPSALSLDLTREGHFLGTPAYMSPEQYLGEPTDARSDQFSFCVTLYQALYGQRPFTGDTLNGLAFNVLQGKVRPAPAKSRVPSHLRKVVLRGLAVDPKERYPSMRELLGALAPVSSSVRTRWLWAAAGGALAVGVAVGGAAVSRESPCSGAAERLENIWDAPRRNAIASAFAATELPYATSTWDHVADDLDAYARRWIDGYTDACEATRRGDQSPALLDRRMLCFDRGRTELRALSDGFAKADAQVVENAREGAAALPRLDVCDDTKALLAAVPPPAGDAARAQEQQIRERLAEARVHDLRGEWATAFEMTQAAVEDAAALEYPPLHADALLLLAKLQHQHDHPEEAVETFHEVVLEASRGQTDELVARAWIGQLNVVGTRQNKYEQALWSVETAEASIVRAGGDALLQAELDL